MSSTNVKWNKVTKTALKILVCLCIVLFFIQISSNYPSLDEERQVRKVEREEHKFKKYAIVKPNNYSEDCKIDPQCSVGCDVCCNLPYNVKTGKLVVHQLLAESELWNAYERQIAPLRLREGSLILYVGANVQGSDGLDLMKECPKCHLHMFEPVPEFYEYLMEAWNKLMVENDWSVFGHLYGLGDRDRTAQLSESDIKGQGTFVMSNSGQDDSIEMEIREAGPVIRKIASNFNDTVDLLHVNCEGCEWEMFENIIEHNLQTNIRIIQFGAHYFDQVDNIAERYCKIREALNRTHYMVYGEPWAWERWDRRRLNF